MEELPRSARKYDRPGGAPWELGRPQAAIATLVARGRIRGRVLDAGCGSGHNTALLASVAREVVGVDASATAIARAEVPDNVDLRCGDVLSLAGERFDCVVDSGLYHNFDDDDRGRYLRMLSRVLRSGGRLFLLVFSDLEPDGWGPRRISQQHIRETFTTPWRVEAIEASIYENLVKPPAAQAWLATVRRGAGQAA